MRAVRPESAAIAYGRIAWRYDEIARTNPINAYMRTRSLRFLRESFGRSSRLIEFGCGTGDEAIALAQEGHAVFATDPSPEMIETARSKVAAQGLSDRVQLRVLDPVNLPEAKAELERFRPSGAYASFAFGYVEELRGVVAELAGLLPPDAPLVFSVPNRFCAWELLLGLGIFQPAFGWRRFRPSYPYRVGTSEVPLRAHSVEELIEVLSPSFVLDRTEGLCILVPPSYLGKYLLVRVRLPAPLVQADLKLARNRQWSRLGDVLLLRFRRLKDAPERR